MSRRGAMAAAILGLALLVGQAYRDSLLIAGMRTEITADRHDVAAARAAKEAAESHDADLTASAREVLKRFKALATAADRCRI